MAGLSRKATCFISRGSGEDAQLLVFFRFAGAEPECPGGTIEDGETFEAGARRDAFEETKLPELTLIGELGARTYELGREGWSLLCRDARLRNDPRPDAPVSGRLRANWHVGVLASTAGWSRVVCEGIEGWLRDDDLYERQERRFYHFRVPADSPDRWRVLENRTTEIELFWLPLAPRPRLVQSNQRWLEEFYDALVEGVKP